MPNWCYNSFTAYGSPEEIQHFMNSVQGKNGDFDFNSIIPMPHELSIQSGSNSEFAMIRVIYEHYGPDRSQWPVGVRNAFFTDFGMEERKARSDTWFDSLPDGERDADKEYLFDESSSPRTKADALYLGNLMIENIEKYGAKDWYSWCNKNWGTKWNAGDIERTASDDGRSVTFRFDTAWGEPTPVFEKMIEMFPAIHFTGEYTYEEDLMQDEDSISGTWEGNSRRLALGDAIRGAETRAAEQPGSKHLSSHKDNPDR